MVVRMCGRLHVWSVICVVGYMCGQSRVVGYMCGQSRVVGYMCDQSLV